MSIFLSDETGRNELAAVPVYGLFALAGNYFYIALTLVAVIAGVGICEVAAEKPDEHDFGSIVWDEVAGFLVTMCWVPVSFGRPSLSDSYCFGCSISSTWAGFDGAERIHSSASFTVLNRSIVFG